MISKQKIGLLILSIVVLICASFSLKNKSTNLTTYEINLKWIKAYPKQNFETVKLGMLWSFSYMGAMLPKNCLDSAITFIDSSTFQIKFEKLGFNKAAIEALAVICDSLKKSEEYKTNQSLDMSKFFVLTLYSPYHYYKITQCANTLNDFIKQHNLLNPMQFGVTVSMVSKGHRLIKFTKDTTNVLAMGYMAEEGEGSLIDKSFKSNVFECFDVMHNGQFRYAIYNADGELTDMSSAHFSTAGSVGKCMWCHETYIQPLFTKNVEVQQMLSNVEFEKYVSTLQKKLEIYRKSLNTSILFENKQDHTNSELLYISFMEPSAMRLKNEFGNDSLAFKKCINSKTHLYDEFPFLGELYKRNEVEKFKSFKTINLPESIREKSKYQANYFR